MAPPGDRDRPWRRGRDGRARRDRLAGAARRPGRAGRGAAIDRVLALPRRPSGRRVGARGAGASVLARYTTAAMQAATLDGLSASCWGETDPGHQARRAGRFRAGVRRRSPRSGRAHPDAEITLLTTAPFAGWRGAAPWFDRVVVDARPALVGPAGLLRLRAGAARLRLRLRPADLGPLQPLFPAGRAAGLVRHRARRLAPARQSARATRCTRWSGSASSSRWPGSPRSRAPDLRWLTAGGPARAAALCAAGAGAAPHRPAKRWPAARFGGSRRCWRRAGCGRWWSAPGRTRPLAADDRGRVPGGARPDRAHQHGRTRRAGRARRAGGRQRHRADAPGRRRRLPVAWCCSPAHSDPALTAPRGRVTVLREADLADLAVERVAALPRRGHECRSHFRRDPEPCPPSPCPTAPFAASTGR